MPFIAPIAAIAGLGISVAGGIMAANAQQQQGRQMQQAENYNAAVARQTAEATRVAGQFEVDKQRRENARFLGTQRARMAASGVTFSGSPLDVMSDTIADQELDLAALRYNTEIGAGRAMSQAGYSDFLGKSYAKQGAIAGNENLFKAGTTLLTSGANISNKYAGAFKYKPTMNVGGN
jgi:hypothetical protein